MLDSCLLIEQLRLQDSPPLIFCLYHIMLHFCAKVQLFLDMAKKK